MHDEFVREVATKVPGRILLETNGTLPAKLANVIDAVDIISMDIKMPDSVKTARWEEHAAFADIAAARDLYIKIVVTADTADDDLAAAFAIVKRHAPMAQLFLQPVTPRGNKQPPSVQKLLSAQAQAVKLGVDARIVPQIHPLLGIL